MEPFNNTQTTKFTGQKSLCPSIFTAFGSKGMDAPVQAIAPLILNLSNSWK